MFTVQNSENTEYIPQKPPMADLIVHDTVCCSNWIYLRILLNTVIQAAPANRFILIVSS